MPIICWGNLAKSADDTQRIEQSIQGYVEGHDENPNAHMGVDYSLGAHRLQTALDHPYGSIKYYHVYDIHAESITAGGLVVKGAGPYISVQDAGGSERVKVYPEGIIVNDGFVFIQDYMARPVFDSRGVVSTNNFQAPGTSNEVLNQVFTASADVTGSSITFALARSAVVLFVFHASVRVENNVENNCNFQVSFYLDGLGKEALDFLSVTNGDNRLQSAENHYFVTLAAGSHTIKLRGSVSNPVGTPYALVYRFRLSYVILGS